MWTILFTLKGYLKIYRTFSSWCFKRNENTWLYYRMHYKENCWVITCSHQNKAGFQLFSQLSLHVKDSPTGDKFQKGPLSLLPTSPWDGGGRAVLVGLWFALTLSPPFSLPTPISLSPSSSYNSSLSPFLSFRPSLPPSCSRPDFPRVGLRHVGPYR